jgi:hypothetical protein
MVEGSSVTFTFRATTNGNPATYVFKECNHTADDKYLRNTTYNKVASNQIQFVIDNLSVTDRGIYACAVTNGIENKNGDSTVKASRNLDLKSMLFKSFNYLFG